MNTRVALLLFSIWISLLSVTAAESQPQLLVSNVECFNRVEPNFNYTACYGVQSIGFVATGYRAIERAHAKVQPGLSMLAYSSAIGWSRNLTLLDWSLNESSGEVAILNTNNILQLTPSSPWCRGNSSLNNVALSINPTDVALAPSIVFMLDTFPSGVVASVRAKEETACSGSSCFPSNETVITPLANSFYNQSSPPRCQPYTAKGVIPFRSPRRLVWDSFDGTLYVAQSSSIFAITSDGSASPYVGNKEGLYLPLERLPFLNATGPRLDIITFPDQIAIDESRRHMYIAEGSLSSIRRVNMTNGATEVIFSGLLWPELQGTWPPGCVTREGCNASLLPVQAPRAIALYYPRSRHNETWLFIGDVTFTAVFLIRFNEETLLAPRTATATILFGSYSPQQGGPLKNAVTSLAVDDGVLFIAADSLWSFPLDDPAPPPVPSPPPSVEENSAVVTAGSVTQLLASAAAIVSGSAVSADATTQIALSMVDCRSTVQTNIPASAYIVSVFVSQGALSIVVGQFVLLAAVFCLHFLVTLVYQQVFLTKDTGGLEVAMIATKFPNYSFGVASFLSQGAFLGAWRLLLSGALGSSGGNHSPFMEASMTDTWLPAVLQSDAGNVCLGILGLFLALTPAVVGEVLYRRFVVGELRFVLYVPQIPANRRWLLPEGEWMPTSLTARFGPFFQHIRDGTVLCRWWIAASDKNYMVPNDSIAGGNNNSSIVSLMRPDELDAYDQQLRLRLLYVRWMPLLVMLLSSFWLVMSMVDCTSMMALLGLLFLLVSLLILILQPYRLPLVNVFSAISYFIMCTVSWLRAANAGEDVTWMLGGPVQSAVMLTSVAYRLMMRRHVREHYVVPEAALMTLQREEEEATELPPSVESKTVEPAGRAIDEKNSTADSSPSVTRKSSSDDSVNL